METEVANTAGWHGWHLRVAHLVSFLCLFLLARKAVATMVPAAAKCIDERNVNHPRRRD